MWDLAKELGHLFLRTTILYGITLVIFRMMGKRSLGNMAPFDLAVVIIIGEAAAIPIEEKDIPILHGVAPIFFLGVLAFLLSLVNIYWKWFEKLTQGQAVLVVQDGKAIAKNMKKEHLSQADLVSLLRDKEVERLEDVKEAWLEPTGKLTVIKKKEVQPITPKDLNHISLDSLDIILEQNVRRMREDLRRFLEQERARRGEG